MPDTIAFAPPYTPTPPTSSVESPRRTSVNSAFINPSSTSAPDDPTQRLSGPGASMFAVGLGNKDDRDTLRNLLSNNTNEVTSRTGSSDNGINTVLAKWFDNYAQKATDPLAFMLTNAGWANNESPYVRAAYLGPPIAQNIWRGSNAWNTKGLPGNVLSLANNPNYWSTGMSNLANAWRTLWDLSNGNLVP